LQELLGLDAVGLRDPGIEVDLGFDPPLQLLGRGRRGEHAGIRQPLLDVGQSKVGAEQLIDKARANGLRATVFRPRLITGAGRFGILMKLFRLMRLGLPVPLIGDGRNRYQMVSVGDCVAAALLAVERGLPAGPFHLRSDDPPTEPPRRSRCRGPLPVSTGSDCHCSIRSSS
jgi:hypothetical protein